MRVLVVGILLAANVKAAPAPCAWVEPAHGPRLEVVDGTVRFSWPLDPKWFACARKGGGAMSISFLRRDLQGASSRVKEFQRTEGAAAEALPLATICDAAPTADVRVRVVGSGPLDRLLHETDPVAVPCFSCRADAAKSVLAAVMDAPGSPPGFVTVKGRWDAGLRCREDAGALSLAVYVGRSELEVRTRRDHSFVIAGLEKDPVFRRAFAPTNACAEATWIGLAFLGTSEFRQLDGTPRATLRLSCPQTH